MDYCEFVPRLFYKESKSLGQGTEGVCDIFCDICYVCQNLRFPRANIDQRNSSAIVEHTALFTNTVY